MEDLNYTQISEIGDRMREHWKKTNGPNEQYFLSLGKKVLEQAIFWYGIYRELEYNPNSVERILTRCVEVSDDIDKVIGKVGKQWSDQKDKGWTSFPRSKTFIVEVITLLKTWGYKGKRGRDKKEYPEEEIKKLSSQGNSVRAISKKLGIPKSSIQDVLKRQED